MNVFRILSYLNGMKPGPMGETRATISRMMTDLDLSRDEIYERVMAAQREGLIHIMRRFEPVPFGLMVVGITGKGRTRLREKYVSHIPCTLLMRDPFNLRVGPI